MYFKSFLIFKTSANIFIFCKVCIIYLIIIRIYCVIIEEPKQLNCCVGMLPPKIIRLKLQSGTKYTL